MFIHTVKQLDIVEQRLNNKVNYTVNIQGIIACFVQLIKEFGTDHVYSADTFNEMDPSSRYE